MERTFKTWGERWLIWHNDTAEVSILYLFPYQRCSWHWHQTKYNLFFVVEGRVDIVTEWGAASVSRGQVFTTRPGEKHEFRTGKEGATVVEIMFVKYDPEDIIRETIGGALATQDDEQ